VCNPIDEAVDLLLSEPAVWVTAEAAYEAAGPAGNEPFDLPAGVREGWVRQIPAAAMTFFTRRHAVVRLRGSHFRTQA
jgi:hypothetical protein